ncbi:hypothetical protein K501DRAFT_326162 [Backusella circina FSU 941]|nr:hypothetical protein K501DRAFT_326162 [Backusella circina FSU 941]
MDNQMMSSYEQPNTPIIPEKLPGIDKLPKLESATPSPPAPSAIQIKQEEQQQQQQHQQVCHQSMLPSTAYLPPPSHSPAAPYNSFSSHHGLMNSNMYNQHISPPLTPAVSPSSVLLDSMQFKRKFSVDVGPFGFGTNIPHPTMMQHDQDAYRRSSCSAMSMEDCGGQNAQAAAVAAAAAAAAVGTTAQDYTQFLTSSGLQESATAAVAPPSYGSSPLSASSNDSKATTTSSRRGSRAHMAGPNTQHKHVCNYPYCSWSFKRYEHLKRHMLVHTGKKPHVCNFPGCGKSFSRSDNFHAHCRTHNKKSSLSRRTSQVPSNSGQSSPSTAAANAAAVACVAAAAASSSVDSAQSSSQVFDERATPAYFTKQPFEIAYQDMYGNRPTYTPDDANDYHQQNQYMRNFSPIQHFGMHSSASPPSPAGVSSLLNHETANQHPFFHQNMERPMNYSMSTTANAQQQGFHQQQRESNYGYYPMPNTPMSDVNTGSTNTSTSPMSNASSTRRSSSSSNNQQKSHICPVPQCQRRFKRLEHLKRHMRIHTMERPFACSFPNCHKTFSRSDNLSQHMKTHQRGEDRRKRQHQQQQQQHDNFSTQTMKQQQHLPPLNESPQPSTSMSMVGMSWHSANAGTVGC